MRNTVAPNPGKQAVLLPGTQSPDSKNWDLDIQEMKLNLN
jgi:hypothetical protein